MPADPKDVLKNYLQGARDTLLWKLEGLSERDLRLPRTSTGINLLGIVKHAINTEVLYFGPTFGGQWPTPEELVPPGETDPQADWYATADESAARLVDLYERVQSFADETIDALPLDAIGHAAHWGGAEVTLHEVMVHKTVDLQRHAGHADIVREQIDGATGLLRQASNVPDGHGLARIPSEVDCPRRTLLTQVCGLAAEHVGPALTGCSARSDVSLSLGCQSRRQASYRAHHPQPHGHPGLREVAMGRRQFGAVRRLPSGR